VSLPDTYKRVRKSIVAFAAAYHVTPLGETPIFPHIIGTGFVAREDGIIITNDHVVRALRTHGMPCDGLLLPQDALARKDRDPQDLTRRVSSGRATAPPFSSSAFPRTFLDPASAMSGAANFSGCEISSACVRCADLRGCNVR
jgi:S1-C subfamily serine protease